MYRGIKTLKNTAPERGYIGLIHIVDSIMGSGKTQAVLRMINEDTDRNRKWLYITPYLDEVERVIRECPKKYFLQPKNFGSKSLNFQTLVREGKNIATTHALFTYMNGETASLILDAGYTLVIDEALENVSYVPIKKWDEQVMNGNFASINDEGAVVWEKSDYEGVFDVYKAAADDGRLYYVEDGVYLSVFPYKILENFQDVYVLTYMFDAQIMRYMLDFNGVAYDKLSAKKTDAGYELIPYTNAYDHEYYASRIHILDHRKLNSVGDMYWDLSSTWYKKHAKTGEVDQIGKNCYNFFHNIVHQTSDHCMWTTFKAYQDKVCPRSFKKGFLAQNARATNQFADRVAVAYTVNQFMLTPTKMFLQNNGIAVDENAYALSNMIQFIWRSNIRQGGEVDVYVPSSRMRELLLDFMRGNNHIASEG